MRDDRLDDEERFHAKDRKQFKRERKIASATDRSKFKKSDQPDAPAPFLGSSLPRGRVVSIGGEGVSVDHEGRVVVCTLRGLLKKEEGSLKNLVAVGDWVRFEQISSSQGQIREVEPRTSQLTRVDVSGKKEQLIASNVDQLLVVASLSSPPLKPALIDRYLIAAAKGRLSPVIVINKLDLLDRAPEEERRLYKQFLAVYEPLGVPILSVSTYTGVGIEALRGLMVHKTTVLSGQSGVGKSSLLNTAFGLCRKTGELAQKTEKGTHTTTAAELIPLPQGGYCVDTPGIRSFAIWNLEKGDVLAHFSDLAPAPCRFPDCTHRQEPGCSVLAALADGKASRLRYESYVSLLDEAVGGIDNRTKRKLEG
jgi:ribosome biogenesis GTPase